MEIYFLPVILTNHWFTQNVDNPHIWSINIYNTMQHYFSFVEMYNKTYDIFCRDQVNLFKSLNIASGKQNNTLYSTRFWCLTFTFEVDVYNLHFNISFLSSREDNPLQFHRCDLQGYLVNDWGLGFVFYGSLCPSDGTLIGAPCQG